MSTITHEKQDAGTVGTPAAGKVRQYVDTADSLPHQVDENGVNTALQGAASSLQLSGETIACDTAGQGAVGDVLAQTVAGGSPECEFRNPRVDLISHMVWQKRAVVVAGPQVNDLTLDELLIVDLEDVGGAGADVEVLLPPAAVGSVHRAVAIKIFGAADAHTLTLTPDGADVIDKALTTLDLTTDRASVMLRVRVGGGGWVNFNG